MGKNFGETIDELIILHEEVISICKKILKDFEPLQNLSLTIVPQFTIIDVESEGRKLNE